MDLRDTKNGSKALHVKAKYPSFFGGCGISINKYATFGASIQIFDNVRDLFS